MNSIDENRPTDEDDDRRFDLLVDGELSERQRRELLAGLDHEPGGWRRCALAFFRSLGRAAIIRRKSERRGGGG